MGMSDIDGAADGLGLAAIMVIMIDQKEKLYVFCEPQSINNSIHFSHNHVDRIRTNKTILRQSLTNIRRKTRW